MAQHRQYTRGTATDYPMPAYKYCLYLQTVRNGLEAPKPDGRHVHDYVVLPVGGIAVYSERLHPRYSLPSMGSTPRLRDHPTVNNLAANGRLEFPLEDAPA